VRLSVQLRPAVAQQVLRGLQLSYRSLERHDGLLMVQQHQRRGLCVRDLDNHPLQWSRRSLDGSFQPSRYDRFELAGGILLDRDANAHRLHGGRRSLQGDSEHLIRQGVRRLLGRC